MLRWSSAACWNTGEIECPMGNPMMPSLVVTVTKCTSFGRIRQTSSGSWYLITTIMFFDRGCRRVV